MKKQLSVAVIGCGNRGCEVYAAIMTEKQADRFSIAALCDISAKALSVFGTRFGVPEENRFLSEEDFFQKKRADILVIATQDADHVRQAVKALSLGYDILLEKPISDKREECKKLAEAQEKYGGKVMLCYVLRYAPAFVKVRELLKQGAIGRLVMMDCTEEVFYKHQAHSFVRGSWANAEKSTPMLIAKSCHDLDMIAFLAGSPCKSVSSFGDLTFFTPDNAPTGATERCFDCPLVNSCIFSAEKIYLEPFQNKPFGWPADLITKERPVTAEAVTKALQTGPYGRCVFHCDNTAVDHQVVSMAFENGVKAVLTMTGFTKRGGRIYILRGTAGEIELNEENGVIILKPFGKEDITWHIADLGNTATGHGGGDEGLVCDLYDVMSGKTENLSSLAASLESHWIGIAAEESRLHGGALTEVHK